MKILVLNCGSSSLKYQLINMETEEVLASGKYERIGEKEAFITHKACGKKVTIEHSADNHTEAIEFTLVATLSDLLVRMTGALVPAKIAPFK